MKITHYSDIPSKHFDSESVKGVSARVAIGKADGAENFCMRVFEVAENGYSPRHSHEWEHEIFIHAGNGEVLCKNKWIAIRPGCAVFIPGNEDHQIRNTGNTPLVFACLIPSGAPEI